MLLGEVVFGVVDVRVELETGLAGALELYGRLELGVEEERPFGRGR